jgi:hypothetical protein
MTYHKRIVRSFSANRRKISSFKNNLRTRSLSPVKRNTNHRSSAPRRNIILPSLTRNAKPISLRSKNSSIPSITRSTLSHSGTNITTKQSTFFTRNLTPKNTSAASSTSLSSPTLPTKSNGKLMPTRAILACDENYKYIQFWEPVALHWQKHHNIKPTLFFIGSPSTPINKTIGDVIILPPLPGMPSSFMAQVIRLLAPSMFPNDICVICDIDLFLLDKTFFSRYLSNVSDTHFASLNRYPAKMNRMSMCYQIAKGSLFGNLFGCDGRMESILSIIRSWAPMSKNWGTDEQVLTSTLRQWSRNHPNQWHLIHTPNLWGIGFNGQSKTISRYWRNSKYDEKLLQQNQYIEFEPPRPLSENMTFVKHVLTSTIPGFVFPTITYMGKNTGPSRHPADKAKTKSRINMTRLPNITTNHTTSRPQLRRKMR